MQAADRRKEQSIRTRLHRIVLVPTAALVALWLVVSGYLFYGAAVQYAIVKGNEEMLTPSALALTSLMDERSATLAYLERPAEHTTALQEARAASDTSMNSVLDKFEGLLPFSPAKVQTRIEDLRESFDRVPEIRALVDSGQASRDDVSEYYDGLILAGADLFDEQARLNPSKEAVGPGLSATYLFRAVDLMSQADAQLSRAFASGELSTADQQEFTRLVGAYHSMLDAVGDYLGPEQAERLEAIRADERWSDLVALEGEISGRVVATTTDPFTGGQVEDTSMPVGEEEWRTVYAPTKDALTELGAEQALWAGDLQAEIANEAILLAVAGSLGVAAVSALAFTISIRATRRLVARLNRLRDETQELADRRLPGLIERLRRNEEVDVAAELPEVSQSPDEIGEVARSFNAAQRTAVEAAVQQAELREGVNRVFLNIAHRSQTLVHRQLRLLDRLEREQEDPEQLTELFKLDHLATRSRRNAENLLILGGESPGRTWHRPMPLIDVIRGAISESGDYTRVKRQRIARVSLSGPAVADVIHLVAELVDNATTFSPPHTSVHLRSEQVPNGVTIEIEDRGLGMKEEEFAATNELLANPPEFDVMRLNEKMRLGLFVVSRLAQRHGISVRLRSSPYGGVQAIVLLPSSLIVADPKGPDPKDGATDSAPEDDAPSHEDGAADAEAVPGDVLAAVPDGEERTPSPQRLPRRSPGLSRASLAPSGPLFPPSPASPAETGPKPTVEDEPAEGDTPAQGSSAERPRLPKRRPQANLAPQLYDTSLVSLPERKREADPGDDAGPDRSLRLRRNMSAFQQGTRRGREEGRQRQNDTEKDA
ncbi:ATP-binding protein [Marinactinospora endophytica]